MSCSARFASWTETGRHACSSIAVALMPVAAAALEPVGAEIPIPGPGSPFVLEGHADGTPDGGFVAVWSPFTQPHESDVLARRYGSDGTPIGSEFPVNTYTTDLQRMPQVGVAADGAFVVVWVDDNAHDGFQAGIFGQRFDSAGSPLGSEFQVNSYWTGNQFDPSIAMAPDGGFVVAWGVDLPQDGNGPGVFARRFASNGAALGTDFQVNTYTTGAQQYPSVEVDETGRSIITWSSVGQDGSGQGIFARIFSSAGAPLGSDFQVNSYTTGNQGPRAEVAVGPSGSFVITWSSFGQDGSDSGVFAQRFASTGARIGGEFQVNAATEGRQYAPTIATRPDGDFMVVWYEQDFSAMTSNVVGRVFSNDGLPRGDDFPVNESTDVEHLLPQVADLANGFVVVWPSITAPSEDGRFSARIFAGPARCAPTPAVCDSSAKAIVKVKSDVGNPDKNLLVWKWLLGTIDDAASFGDPTDCTSYALCIYDDGVLKHEYQVEPAGTCGGDPCWSAAGQRGFKYKNPAGNEDGIVLAKLLSGAGKAKLLLKGKGSNLAVPATDPLFTQSADVTVQLVRSAGGGCWESGFAPPALKNTEKLFKDKILP